MDWEEKQDCTQVLLLYPYSSFQHVVLSVRQSSKVPAEESAQLLRAAILMYLISKLTGAMNISKFRLSPKKYSFHKFLQKLGNLLYYRFARLLDSLTY